jgi:cytochrome c oxidase assembly factor CtaG
MNPKKIMSPRHLPIMRHLFAPRHIAAFCGLLILVACIAVPFPALDYDTPFTGHMVRHVGLLLLAAPLLAMAIPSDNPMRKTLTNLSRLTARRPMIAWVAGVSMMWFWHLPVLYNAPANAAGILSCSPFLLHPIHAAAAIPIHATSAALPAPTAAAPLSASITLSLPTTLTSLIPVIRDASLLVAGFLFYWPLVTPYPSFRLPALQAILYLAFACITCSLAGLLITYAPHGMYRGVSVHDQQSGGLIMWVPCCFLYLSASMWLLIRWLSQKEPLSIIHP